MYCKNCGHQLADDHNVCTQCGIKRGEGEGFCQQCGAQKVPGSDFCTSCGLKFVQNGVNLEKSEPEPADAGETQVLQPGMLVQPNDPYPQNQPIQQFQPQNPQDPQYAQYPQDSQYQQYQQYPQDAQYQQQYYAPQRKGFCRNCGAEVMQGSSACTNCGTNYGQGSSFCHRCGAAAVPGAETCTSCGKSLKPPYTFGSYIKEYFSNFLFGKNSRSALSIVTRIIPTVFAIAAFIIMLCPVAVYTLIPGSSSYYGNISSYSDVYNYYSSYSSSSTATAAEASYQTASMNAFGLSVFGGILFILAFAFALLIKEPFTNSFCEKKPVLAKLSLLFVPLLDTIAVGCLALGFLSKFNASDNSYIFIASYPELNIGVGGWILVGVVVVSLVCGIISALNTKATSSNPPVIPAPSVNIPPVPPVSPTN